MFKLKADPTFSAKVEIPVAGGPSVPVVFIFKHRTQSELIEWDKGIQGRSDFESFMDMVQGWVTDKAEAKTFQAEELSEEFTPENVKLLLEERIGVALATKNVYYVELTKAREKN